MRRAAAGPARLRHDARRRRLDLRGRCEFDELARLIGRLDELRAESGRTDVPFQVHAGSLAAFSADGVRRLAELSVTDVSIGFRDPYTRGPDTQPLAEKIRHLHTYADKVISRLRG
ncbi:MAG: hypothetical protein L0H84_24295 [Pseudonocardia sp.]|nr:hypothetical protein [Pseudonocardia sp.]